MWAAHQAQPGRQAVRGVQEEGVVSEPTYVPCSICGRQMRLQPWALIWGRPQCRECQDYSPDEPGIFEQGDHDEED